MHITIKLLQPINARRKLHDIYTCLHNGYIKNVHTWLIIFSSFALHCTTTLHPNAPSYQPVYTLVPYR